MSAVAPEGANQEASRAGSELGTCDRDFARLPSSLKTCSVEVRRDAEVGNYPGMTELDRDAALAVFQGWCSSFGVPEDFAANRGHHCVASVGKFRDGIQAVECAARLKLAPVYLVEWLSYRQTVWALDLERLFSAPFQGFLLPGSEMFLVDAEFLWAYFDAHCCSHCRAYSAPHFRLCDDYQGPLPWRDPRESRWYRADSDLTHKRAEDNYSLPNNLLP